MPFERENRILDANVNRACEGLRVIEEIARFLFDDAASSDALKRIRHFLRELFPRQELLARRDAEGDVGKGNLRYGSESRSGLADIAAANFKRVEEALRVIEEFSKLESSGVDEDGIARLEASRYEVYTLEKLLQTRIDRAAGEES